ncbi:MAG: hypothetical protein GH155_00490 [Spirochaeta sp.]|nr:hypothetical protein [Spirochaeta sp.]
MGLTFRNLTCVLILLSIFVFTTVSCQGNPDAQPGPERTGAVSKGISGVKKQDYRKGEILVKFRSSVNRPAMEKIIEGLDLEIIKVVLVPNLYLLRIPRDSTVPKIIERLRQFEEVEYSEPNYIRSIYGKDGRK